MSDRANLGNFLKEVINWKWDEFLRAEKDSKYSPLQATVFALVRSCSDGKLGAIKLAIKRVDGALETPVQTIFPKVYFRYPYAKQVGDKTVAELEAGAAPDISHEISETIEDIEKSPQDLEAEFVTYGLRETLNKMADTPDRRVVPLILNKKQEVEDIISKKLDTTKVIQNVPAVKSVIAANLLDLAMEQNSFEAITEVFDQIDGKLVETVRFLGDDMFMDQYDEIAPAGAKLNSDGVYMLEQKEITNAWEQKFASRIKL